MRLLPEIFTFPELYAVIPNRAFGLGKERLKRKNLPKTCLAGKMGCADMKAEGILAFVLLLVFTSCQSLSEGVMKIRDSK